MDIKYQTLQGNIITSFCITDPGIIGSIYGGYSHVLVIMFSNADIYGLIYTPLLGDAQKNFMDTLPTKNTACNIQIIKTPSIKTKTPIDVWIETDTDVFSGDVWIGTEEEIKKEYLKLTLSQ